MTQPCYLAKSARSARQEQARTLNKTSWVVLDATSLIAQSISLWHCSTKECSATNLIISIKQSNILQTNIDLDRDQSVVCPMPENFKTWHPTQSDKLRLMSITKHLAMSRQGTSLVTQIKFLTLLWWIYLSPWQEREGPTLTSNWVMRTCRWGSSLTIRLLHRVIWIRLRISIQNWVSLSLDL